MTVSSEVNSVSYAGNGTTTVFAIPYYFLENSHIRAIRRSSAGAETVLVINVDYTLTGAGVQAGGTLTATVAPATGTTLVITRSVPATQETDYPANDPFPSSSHERALDKLTMIAQQNVSGLKSAIRVPDTDPEPARLPTASNRASQLMGFDVSGNPIAVVPTSGSAADLALNLLNPTDMLKGVTLVGGAMRVINSVADISGLLKTGTKRVFMMSYNGLGGGGGGELYLDEADTTSATDNGTIFVAADGGRWKRPMVGDGRAVPVSWFGATLGADSTTAFIRAATYLLKRTFPGGDILVDGNYTVAAGQVNFWNILATEQGITPASDFLPNGELVRGTYIGLIGYGWDYSRITVTGSGDAFVWGNFTNISSKRAMSGKVRDIDFKGPGAVGHTSQVIISGAQGFSTTTNASAGTTNTNTRCLVFQECVPTTFIEGCRFRYFQEAVHQTYGFGLVLEKNDIQYCNVALFFDVGVTTWIVGDGNEIEVCAVGVYSKNTANGSIKTSIIEANLAGCDVLIWCSKFLTVEGAWFEGSVKNVILRGDVTAPSVPNSGITFSKCVGLNIDNNGGVKDLAVTRCAMNALGEVYGVNTGETFINVLYDNCTLSEGPFNMASISISGIATLEQIQVVGRSTNGVIADTVSRPNLHKKGLTITSSNTAVKAFALNVTNAETTCRIEIQGYKRSSAAADMQMQTQRYVGVMQRFAGSSAVVQFSTTESITTAHTATGANAPVNVATPSVVITGGATATQNVEFRFPTGTSTSSTAWNFWEVTVMNETGGITFE